MKIKPKDKIVLELDMDIDFLKESSNEDISKWLFEKAEKIEHQYDGYVEGFLAGEVQGIQYQKAKQDKFIEKLKYVLRNNYTIPDEKPRFKARKELIEMIIKDLDKLAKEVLEK